MATKSKSNSLNIISTIIAVIIVTLSSIGMIMSYPKIEKLSISKKNKTINLYEEQYFLENLSKISYYLYYDLLRDNDNNLKPSDIIMSIKPNVENIKDYTNYKKEFDKEVINFDYLIDETYLNLDYYALNKANNQFKSRSYKDLNLLLNDNSNIESFNEYYNFYVVLDFDEFGNMTIEKINGADKSKVLRYINSTDIEFDIVELSDIKNMKFVYAVPKTLSYHDVIESELNRIDRYIYEDYSFSVALSYSSIFSLVVFFIPYKLTSKSSLFKSFSKIPVEIIFISSLFVLTFIVANGEMILYNTLTNTLTKDKTMDFVLNFVYWFVNFGMVYLYIVLFKHIFKVGFINYIKTSSLIVVVARYILDKSKLVYNFLADIDFKDTNKKKLAMIALLNGFFVSIMCFTQIFGIFVCIFYTIAIFILLNKKYDKIQNDYIKVLDITTQMSNGNLDVSLEKDLGTFNSLKENLIEVKSGFKKAVDKEVKSEKMKTELISNVSHDLKTPLTSIVTYINLLKDKDLEKEKQEEYIEILDKKSQRLKVLIEDLFEVSKASSGNINLNLVDVDIVSLIKQTIFELDDKIKEKQLLIKTNINSEKIILKLDSERTFRVFENLILNITKYSLENSRVYIDVEENIDSVNISFKNISKDEINFTADEIRERFVRGDKSRNTEGSGLGLSIAKSFVEAQGGKFDIVLDGDLFKVIINLKK